MGYAEKFLASASEQVSITRDLADYKKMNVKRALMLLPSAVASTAAALLAAPTMVYSDLKSRATNGATMSADDAFDAGRDSASKLAKSSKVLHIRR